MFSEIRVGVKGVVGERINGEGPKGSPRNGIKRGILDLGVNVCGSSGRMPAHGAGGARAAARASHLYNQDFM